MSLPPLRALRALHVLLFAVLAMLFFAWGVWLMRGPQVQQPLPGLADWQGRVLQPLADGRLSLGDLSAVAEGELWLQSRPDGPRLFYRASLPAAEGAWQLQAELQLSQAERDSLAAASGLQAGAGEQPLGRPLVQQLARQPVLALDLTPASALPVERLVATLGAPRLRLQLAEGEAWVYPLLGLTAQVQDGRLQWLRGVPKSTLQH